VTTKADSKRRVVLPRAKPGDIYDVQELEEGRYLLVRLERARALATRLEEELHVNPNTGTREFSLRDPDGYYVTISALSAG